jgi:hypothetical protein
LCNLLTEDFNLFFMLEMLFVGTGICISGYFIYRMNKKSKFEIGEEEIYFKWEKLSIAYSNIISLEKDISSGKGRTMYFGYIVTYYTEADKIDSFRIYKALDETLKWERFKRKLLEHNPSVKINESVF